MGTVERVVPSQLRLARDRALLVGCVGLVATMAWLALWASGASRYGFFLHHHELAHPVMVRPGLFVLLFVGGWAVMTVAMMLPTTLPLITAFHTITRRRMDRPLLVTLVIGGYLVTWTLFGVVVYLGQVVLRWLVGASPWVAEHSWAVGGSIILLAGVFQFTSLKYRCLDKCRSPLSFVIEHWRGRNDRWQAFRLGVHHGVFCVGCCWALMLLMFAVSVGNLGWMLVLAAVMAIEKNVSWGRRMSAPLGVALLGWGASILVLA